MTNEVYGKFYSPNKLVSTGKPLCFSVGSRSIGKSTGFAIYFLIQYYEQHKKFIYCRRTDDELKRTAADYFGTALSILSGFGMSHNISLKGDEYIDENGDTVGYSVALNMEQKYKSMPFGDLGVSNILYDEFILPRGGERGYLGTSKNFTYEYNRLISLYQTVDRKRGASFRNETRIFACANNASFYNPLFVACDCDKYISWNTKFCNPKNELWACELTREVEATKEIKKSNGYLLAAQTEKAQMYDNNSLINDSQIKKLDCVMNGICTCLYNGNTYGIYLIESKGIIYVCSRKVENRPTLSLTIGDTTEINYVTSYKYKDTPYMSFLREMVNKGKCIFETARTKSDILTYLNFTL